MPHKDEFLAKTAVSRETLDEYEQWHALLLKWNSRINLVARSTLPDFWRRHALDTWQITPFFKSTDRQFLDLGSGAGFPGIAAAIALKAELDKPQDPARLVTLTESAGKKASFLRTVIRELDLPAKVHGGRIEELEPFQVDVITARAFAPLDRLLNHAAPFLKDSTRFILLKGAAVDEELELVSGAWTFDHRIVNSLSDEMGGILILKNVKRRE